MTGLCDLCLFGAARALRAPARGTGRGTTAALYVPILSIPIGHRSRYAIEYPIGPDLVAWTHRYVRRHSPIAFM